MFDMNSGYSGYSMSNRAVEAYENGEMPLSKWTKSEIISAIEDIDEEKAAAFKKVNLGVLKDTVLRYSSWHHTSNRCNRTNFYALDTFKIENMSIDEIIALASQKVVKLPETSNKYKGTIYYLEWSGTRKHPKATQCELKNVFIEEKGCFYIVTNENGELLLRKKMDSKGTNVIKA